MDPNYARAYAGLADAYRDLGDPYRGGRLPVETLPRAKAAALQALELDAGLGEAHGALASILMLLDWNWIEAEKHYKLEIQLSPSYARGHYDYGLYLQALARNDEARMQLDQAIELDPLSVEYRNALGFLALTSREYDRAIEQLRNFDYGGWNMRLAWAYMMKGMYPEAVALLEAKEREVGPDPNLLSFLAEAYGGAGRRSDAEKTIREMLTQAHVKYVSPAHIAGAYIGLRDKDKVMTWLERGFEEHDEVVIWVKVAPDLDFVRSEPRFQALLRHMNFPP